ncbi:hypothetical protein G5C33_13115 [Sphingosinithalassobacter tenebrarum]|uniref:Uncharacterized protein n=1 Tax=Stakelama tenebrarum TaxID=2711215 RepID=A0A6G6Y6U4_9SPHN|nr:hypothetical protein G5C33_13115 [Sphingosinithalassobacter tenebrarum]
MHLLLLAGATALAGCADGTDRYPSLLPRDIEDQSLAEPKVPAPVATPDAALDTRIAELREQVDMAITAFDTAARGAESKVAVAAGTATGSDLWLDAQAALGILDSARGQTLDAAVTLDSLAIQRGLDGKPPYPALQTASETANAAAERQRTRIEALERRLAGE